MVLVSFKMLFESLDTPKKMRDHLMAESQKHPMSSRHEDSLLDYKFQDHLPINGYLRTGEDQEDAEGDPVSTSHIKKQIKNLDHVVSQATSRGMHVYRGISHFDPKIHTVGSEHVDHGFVSTTLNRALAHEQAEQMHKETDSDKDTAVMRIHVPRGTKGHYVDNESRMKRNNEKEPHVHPDENEFLLARGSRFHITKIETHTHPERGWTTHLVHAKLLGQGEDNPHIAS